MASGYAVGGLGSSGGGHHGGHGILGLISHFGSDLKNAAFGLPKGLLMTAEHPIRSSELMGKATWQTWSPLFHGHVGTFLHQTYDHPLAPLLDVASVFTGGAGLAARLGTKAGELGLVSEGSRLAQLGKAGTHLIEDKGVKAGEETLKRPALPKYTSKNPVTRYGQNRVLKLMHQSDQHLPTWFTDHIFGSQATYERLHRVDLAHRTAAMNMQIAALMKAGQAITDPATRAKLEPTLLAHNYLNLVRHAHEIDAGTALPPHYAYVLDARHLAGNGTSRLNQLRRIEPKLQARRAAHAEMAHMLPRLVQEQHQIEAHLAELSHIRARTAGLGKANLTAEQRSAEAAKLNRQLESLTKRAQRLNDQATNGLVLHAEGRLATNKVLERVTRAREAQKAVGATKDSLRANRRAGQTAAKEQQLQAARFSGVEMAKLQHADATLAELRKTARRIKGLKARATKSAAIHGKVTDRLGQVMSERMTLEERSFRDFFRRDQSKSFAERIGNFGRDFTTHDLNRAAKTADGRVKVVPLHDVKNLEIEAKNSATFLAKLYRAPTRMWKTLLLGYSPRVVINNGVGNWFMYAMRQGGGHAFRGLVDAVRFTHGETKATKLLGETAKITNPHFLRRYFGDELGNVFGMNTLADEAGKTPSRIRQGLYPLVHKLADQPVRAAAISAFLRSSPEVRAAMKGGLSFEQAATKVLRKNPELRDQAALHARTVAGDYFTVSPVEQRLRDIIPFYLWDKHIVKHVANMATERPARLALAAAVGSAGAESLHNQLGNIPDFMLNSIPLPGTQKGRKLLFSTAGVNPYSTIPDLYDFGQALTTGGGSAQTGESIGGQLNPLVANFIEQVAGKKLTTQGAPVTRGGLFPSILANTAESLPLVQLAEKGARVNQPKTKTTPLYSHSLDEILSSLAGIPIKAADLNRAAQIAAEDQPHHRKKKSSSGFAVAAGR